MGNESRVAASSSSASAVSQGGRTVGTGEDLAFQFLIEHDPLNDPAAGFNGRRFDLVHPVDRRVVDDLPRVGPAVVDGLVTTPGRGLPGAGTLEEGVPLSGQRLASALRYSEVVAEARFLPVHPLEGSPIKERGIIVPSLPAVQSASVIVFVASSRCSDWQLDS